MKKSYSKKFNLDKLYTKPEIAEFCISKLNLTQYATIIEPSAGGGSFSNQLDGCVAFDVSPEHDNIKYGDWLVDEIDCTDSLVIGNPPFGHRNNLSIKFIERGMAGGAKTIAFILPNVYNKHTLQKKIWYNISEVYPLPLNSFTYNGVDYSIPCSFYIFNKEGSDQCRFRPELYKESKFFSFSNSQDFDFFIFGAAPKNVVFVVEPNNRGYYIKCDKGYPIDFVIKLFKETEWCGNSSASGGVSWFTKPEIVFHTG